MMHKNAGAIAVKKNEKRKQMQMRHNDDASLKNRNLEDHEQTQRSMRDIDMILLEPDGKAEENNEMHRHRTPFDLDSLLQEEPIPFLQEKVVRELPTEQLPQEYGGVGGEERGIQRSHVLCDSPIDESMNCDEADEFNDEKVIGIKNDKRNGENQTNKDDISNSFIGIDAEIKYLNCNRKQDFNDKKHISSEDVVVETKNAPRLSQDNDTTDKDSKSKGKKFPESNNQSLQIEDKLNCKPSSSFCYATHELSLEGKSEVVNKQSDDTASLYPLDGRWEMRWKSYPVNNTTFVVHKHVFEMFNLPCEIMLIGPNGNCCPSFQWPEAITSAETPVFQKSRIAFTSGVKNKECPTTIEWTTTDPQYDESTWTRFHSTGCEAEVVKKRSNVTSSLYPLDGNWEMTWKSYPMNAKTIVVQKHKFQMFDFPCEIKLGQLEDFFPSFQWPVEVSSFETPIFQQSNLAIPPDMKSTEWPTSIEWTITDSQYGKTTWTKLDSGTSNRERTSVPGHYESIKKRRKLEEFRMKTSIPGKAWDLVVGAIELSSKTENIKTIAQDDIIYLAERLLKTQKEFIKKNKENEAKSDFTFITNGSENIPCHVDIAYHHTRSENLRTIQIDGLLSRHERETRNIYSNFNGSSFGDGIYCSIDPLRYANQRYGDTTILLARMKGIESSSVSSNGSHTFSRSPARFSVLKCSNQCIPIFQFQSKLLGHYLKDDDVDKCANFRLKLAEFQKQVQTLLDKIFNKNVPTKVDVDWAIDYNPSPSFASIPILGSAINYNSIQPNLQRQKFPLPKNPLINPKPFAPGLNGRSFLNCIIPETIIYTAPDSLTGTEDRDFCKPCLTHRLLVSGCPMCIESLGKHGKVVQITRCGHVFHNTCLKVSMEKHPYCPMCFIPISDKYWCGTMPSGSMTISQVSTPCTGFEGHQTIAILYKIPQGIQKNFHPNPTQQFYSAHNFEAYVPATPEGMELLKRLKFAFSRGLTFSIGTWSGCPNWVVWRVNHKTNQASPSYPNPSYISKCNTELDLLHVPSAVNLSLLSTSTLSTKLTQTSGQQQPQLHPMLTSNFQQPSLSSIPVSTEQSSSLAATSIMGNEKKNDTTGDGLNNSKLDEG